MNQWTDVVLDHAKKHVDRTGARLPQEAVNRFVDDAIASIADAVRQYPITGVSPGHMSGMSDGGVGGVFTRTGFSVSEGGADDRRYFAHVSMSVCMMLEVDPEVLRQINAKKVIDASDMSQSERAEAYKRAGVSDEIAKDESI